MDKERIKELLEKFYNGDTSEEEEKVLKEYFQAEDAISVDMGPDAAIFGYYEARHGEVPGDGFESRFLENIGEKRATPSSSKPVRRIAYISTIAASIIIILGAVLLLRQKPLADTYASAEEAYQETLNTLKYVSSYWEMGTKDLEPIKEFSQPVSNLQNLSKFSEGVGEMENLKSLNKGMEQLAPLTKIENVKRFLNIEIQ